VLRDGDRLRRRGLWLNLRGALQQPRFIWGAGNWTRFSFVGLRVSCTQSCAAVLAEAHARLVVAFATAALDGRAGGARR